MTSCENDLAMLKWMVATVIVVNLAGFGAGLNLLLRILAAIPHA